MGNEAYDDLRRALHDPAVVHAMLEDYRAGLRQDREDEEAERAAGRRITCPLLVVSLLRDDPELDYGVDLAEIWQAWATDVRAAADRLRSPRRRGGAGRARSTLDRSSLRAASASIDAYADAARLSRALSSPSPSSSSEDRSPRRRGDPALARSRLRRRDRASDRRRSRSAAPWCEDSSAAAS